MRLAAISIGARRVGPGEPCYVIAEAGSNHDGDFDQALRLIDAAADARADAVKFQNFRADRLYPPTAGRSDYLGDERNIYDIIRAMEMPPEWLPRLAAHARARGIDFLSSTFDEESVDLVEPHVGAFKCASYEMTHTPLLQDMARRGKPVLLSTGTATMDEVGLAVAAVRATGNDALVVLQCTASYPAPLSSMNVRALSTMRVRFQVLTGLSDHSLDAIVAPMAAVSLGAVVLEKHFTLDRRLPGPDHAFSIEPRELGELVRRVREVEAALGSGDKVVDPVERELRSFARRSVFSTGAIAAGELLSRENTAVLRSGKLGHGLEPAEHPGLLGRRAARAIAAHALVRLEDVEPRRVDARAPPRVEVRRAAPDDCEAIWRWNNSPDVRQVSFDTDPIPLERHRTWFARALAEPTSFLWVIRLEGEDAGVVRIQTSGSDDVCSIALGEGARGRGAGPVAISLACRAFAASTGKGRVVALVKADNRQSARAFERAGFVRLDETTVGGHASVVYEWRAGVPAHPFK